MILNRLRKNLKKRKPLLKGGEVEAYRLYEWDIPEYPYIVDVYKDQVVLYSREDDKIDADKKEHRYHLMDALCELFNIDDDSIIIKERERKKGKNQYEKISRKNIKDEIREYQATLLINLHDYLDTGIFLDHRPMRQRIFSESEGKRVLNLFCYTGTVSVFAALGGASQVTSVDMSKTYLEWAEENFCMNGLEPTEHRFTRANVLDYIKNSSEKFDLIFLDPPTFSNSKRMDDSFDVERDQVSLIEDTMKLLSDDGVLYFSNNKRKFKLDPVVSEKFSIKDISASTIPVDFRDTEIHKCFKITHK